MTLPLNGIKVLDLTQALAGPFSTMILGDLGAEILKIESPSGDLTRSTPPHYIDGDSVYFLTNNRNKRSAVINLKHPDGLAVFYALVEKHDVVVSNYAPGVLERLKIDHDRLIGINPRIITCAVSGFGSHGPEATRRAVDLIVQAMAGGMSITGEPGRPPVRAGVPTADLSAGLYAVIGILAALQARQVTGRGLRVETSLFHAQLSLLNYVAAYCLYSGQVPQPVGSGHPGTVPSQVFQTSDGYLAIDAGFDKHFQLLCDAIGRPELALDPRFVVRSQRHVHRDQLLPLLADVLRARSSQEWIDELDGRGVPCGPVNNVADALASAQSVAYRSVDDLCYRGDTVGVVRTPLWFSGEAGHPMGAPPALGEHTAECLAEHLGYDASRIAELAASGAIQLGKQS